MPVDPETKAFDCFCEHVVHPAARYLNYRATGGADKVMMMLFPTAQHVFGTAAVCMDSTENSDILEEIEGAKHGRTADGRHALSR